MSKINDGGPAYPVVSDLLGHAPGMSLRDVVAPAAFQALLANDALRSAASQTAREDGATATAVLAHSAFQCADAFIAARETKET